MSDDKQLHRVKPSLDELLPTSELLEAYEEASAALEAGRLVRALRKRAGLTQQALAERISVMQARVSAIEAGEGRDGPSYRLLKRIAEACGTSVVSVLADALSKLALMRDAKSSRSAASLEERLRAVTVDDTLVSSFAADALSKLGVKSDAKYYSYQAMKEAIARAVVSQRNIGKHPFGSSRSAASLEERLRAVTVNDTLVSSFVAHALLVRAVMSDANVSRSAASAVGRLRAVLGDETLESSVVAHAYLVRAIMGNAKSSRSAASLDEFLRAVMEETIRGVATHKSWIPLKLS